MKHPTGDGRVGVVVPLYNGGSFIRSTVVAILAQTYQDLEVVVVDDGSVDDGPDVVRTLLADPRLSLARKKNGGIAHTRNTGMHLLSDNCEFLLFVDHDDLIAPTMIERLVEVLRRRSDAAAAYAIADFVDESGAPWHPDAFSSYMRTRVQLCSGRLEPAPADSDATLGELLLSNPIYPPSGLLVRATLMRANGGFDASFGVADDWDSVIKLARRGPVVPYDHVLVGYRRHGDNASGDHARNIRETRAIWARTFYSPLNSPRQQVELQAWWRADQKRKCARKSGEAAQLLSERRPLAAALRFVDAVAHILLRKPLRRWLPVDRGMAAAPAADVAVERNRTV